MATPSSRKGKERRSPARAPTGQETIQKHEGPVAREMKCCCYSNMRETYSRLQEEDDNSMQTMDGILLVTNPKLVAKAWSVRAHDALLIKDELQVSRNPKIPMSFDS